ncbi:unnamed protein product [Ostreobium quekettii]|uniref:Uncharacterized protein n=1 Tax=Ostreobium quekettii TaxID=121088 RepID=A0A8S1ITJ7_9CHLO|nr:unnamed protein product [Ostreobium quekettii]|eukprot:evm.model.scf_1072.4 EVM.evm.TU.scf_1072.4   scf_1072:33985-40144(+)
MGGPKAMDMPGLQVHCKKDGSWRDVNLQLTHVVGTPAGAVLRVGVGNATSIEGEIVEFGEMSKRLQCTPRTASDADANFMQTGLRVLGCEQPQSSEKKWYQCKVQDRRSILQDGRVANEVLVRWDGSEGKGSATTWLSLSQHALKIPVQQDVSQHPKFVEWVGAMEKLRGNSANHLADGRRPQASGLGVCANGNERHGTLPPAEHGATAERIVVDLTEQSSLASDAADPAAVPPSDAFGPRCNGAQAPTPLCASGNGQLDPNLNIGANPHFSGVDNCQGSIGLEDGGPVGGSNRVSPAGPSVGGRPQLGIGREGSADDGGLSCNEQMLDDSDGEDPGAQARAHGPASQAGAAPGMAGPSGLGLGAQRGLPGGYPDPAPLLAAGMPYGGLRYGPRGPDLASLPSAPLGGPALRPALPYADPMAHVQYAPSLPAGLGPRVMAPPHAGPTAHAWPVGAGGVMDLRVQHGLHASPAAMWGALHHHQQHVQAPYVHLPVGGHWQGQMPSLDLPAQRVEQCSLLTSESLSDLDTPRAAQSGAPALPAVGSLQPAHGDPVPARQPSIDLYCSESALDDPHGGAAGPTGPATHQVAPLSLRGFASPGLGASALGMVLDRQGGHPRYDVLSQHNGRKGILGNAAGHPCGPPSRQASLPDFRSAAFAHVPALASLPGIAGAEAGPAAGATSRKQPTREARRAPQGDPKAAEGEGRGGGAPSAKMEVAVEVEWGEEDAPMEGSPVTMEDVSRLGILYLAACCFIETGPGPGTEQFRAARKLLGQGEDLKRRKLSWQDI